MKKSVKIAVAILIGISLILSLTGCKSDDTIAFDMNVDDFFDSAISLAQQYYPDGDFTDLVRDENYGLYEENDQYVQHALIIDDKAVIILQHTLSSKYGDGAIIHCFADETPEDYKLWEALAYGVCLTVNPDCNFDDVLELMLTAFADDADVPQASTVKDRYYYSYIYFPDDFEYSHSLEISGEL